jgi:hypothetical protein
MALCLRSRNRQGAKLELPSESESLSRLSRFAPYSSVSLKNHPAWQQRYCQTKTVMPIQWRLIGGGAGLTKKNRPKDMRLGAFNPLRPIVEHKKSGSSRSFLLL